MKVFTEKDLRTAFELGNMNAFHADVIDIKVLISNLNNNPTTIDIVEFAKDILNFGMELRQNQLNGYATDKSGNELLKEKLENEYNIK